VVQRLSDLSGGRDVRIGSETGISPTGFNQTSLELVDGKGDVQGIYSWTDEIYVGEEEPDRLVRGGSTYEIEGGSARITFSYPIGGSEKIVYHDPTVGIRNFVPEGDDEFTSNRPLVMVGGLMIGIFLVGGSILIRIYGSKRPGGR
jgi:hypothetical protein